MKTIQARVSQRILKKVDRLFDGTPETLFAELLQNARRAGASRVEVTTLVTGDKVFFTFADDGKGIENPHTAHTKNPDTAFLTLGGSNWDDTTEIDEDPAGMGIFSLCAASVSGVEIHSRDWSAILTPAAFTNNEPVVIRDEKPISGTKISFHLQGCPPIRVLENLVEFGPLDVWLNGSRLPRRDFLSDCVYVKVLPDLGVRIGVIPGVNVSVHDTRPLFNFHGLTLRGGAPRRREGFVALVDVINTRWVKLVHPARNAVVSNVHSERLEKECSRALYEHIKAVGNHTLSYAHWQEAKALGVVLPEANARLDRWLPRDRDNILGYVQEIPAAGCLLMPGDDIGIDHSLWRALELKPGALPPLVAPRDWYRGYSWYNALGEIAGLEYVVNGKVVKDRALEKFDTVQKSLAVRVRIRGEKKTRDLATDILLPAADTGCCWEAPNWLVVAGHGFAKDRQPLAELLFAAYFDYNEDSDDRDGQADEFRADRDSDITTKLVGEKEAIEDIINGLLNNYKFDARLVESISVRRVPPTRKQIQKLKADKVEPRFWPLPRFKATVKLCKK